MQISKNSVAVIDYILTGDDGHIYDRSDNGEFSYLHGAGNIIPGLENALEGKQAGDSLDVSVTPGDAYGERDPERIQQVPRDMFEDDAVIEPGTRFHAQSADGHMMVVTVVSVEEDAVTIDGNHELAGMNLNFSVNVREVRAATDEEIEHGHVHASGGCQH